MINLKRNKLVILFAILSLVTAFPLLMRNKQTCLSPTPTAELFNRNLLKYNSLEKIGAYVDSLYVLNKREVFDTAAYVSLASNTTKERFHFGLSEYDVSENWIAYFSGKFIWSHMSAIVKPDDILKHPEGLCSQQTIVFMELLRRKGINVRSVGLGRHEGPGHFICEAHYNDSWNLHDVTKEPEWEKITKGHESMEYYLMNKDSLFRVYEYRMLKSEFDQIIKQVTYGEPNNFAAKKMLFFHEFSYALTYIIPISFLFLAFYFYRTR